MATQHTNERLKKLDAYLAAFAEGIQSLNVSQDRTDAQLKKTIRKLDDIGRQLADQGLVQGEVAEALFYCNMRGMFSALGCAG